MPNPVHGEPLLPAGLVLTGYLASAALVGILGGGVLSGLLIGKGLAVPPVDTWILIAVRAVTNPTDPAMAWPSSLRPGPAWLTWPCVVLVAITWCSAVAILATEVDHRFRRRHREDGLACGGDLRRNGLDPRTAARKAAREYPILTARQPSRRFPGRWWR
ncbi:hypothetical protein ACFYTQ_36675 [Nocardia sp. NPDC004068]|uniref:hypothetical protein n=1 Tax=Nocardia sp. NPDC004068 TaxID=3364303 RepID=UPI0036CB1238